MPAWRVPRPRGRRLLAPQGEQDAETDARQQRDAPGDALADLRRHRPGAHIGHGPADAKDGCADHVAALGPRRAPRHGLPREERPHPRAPQEPQGDERDRHRGGEHLPHVRVTQQQHVSDAIGIDELAPGQEEAEAGPEQNACDPHPRHVNALIAKLTAMAVAMNVPVAVRLAREPVAQPPSPLPEVHPPAVLAP